MRIRCPHCQKEIIIGVQPPEIAKNVVDKEKGNWRPFDLDDLCDDHNYGIRYNKE